MTILKMGSHIVDQAVLKIITQIRVVLSSEQSFCLSLLSTEIIGVNHHILLLSLFIFYFCYIYLFCLCMYICSTCVPWRVCGGQWDRSWFSPSVIWEPEIQLRSIRFGDKALLPIKPSCQPSFEFSMNISGERSTGSVIKSTCCFSKGVEHGSQLHPGGSTAYNSSFRDSYSLFWGPAHTWHILYRHIHINKDKNKLLKSNQDIQYYNKIALIMINSMSWHPKWKL